MNVPELVTARPIVFRQGIPGYIESNCTNAYVGEWVVFVTPFGDSQAEVRFPIEEAISLGLVEALNEEEAYLGDSD